MDRCITVLLLLLLICTSVEEPTESFTMTVQDSQVFPTSEVLVILLLVILISYNTGQVKLLLKVLLSSQKTRNIWLYFWHISLYIVSRIAQFFLTKTCNVFYKKKNNTSSCINTYTFGRQSITLSDVVRFSKSQGGGIYYYCGNLIHFISFNTHKTLYNYLYYICLLSCTVAQL